MRLGKINYLLSLFENKNLISSEQREQIFAFMKERKKEQFFRLIQWLFIMGGFWLVFGFLAVINLLNFGLLEKIGIFLHTLITPVMDMLHGIFGNNYLFALWAGVAIGLWALFAWLGSRIQKRESLSDLKLSYFQESRLRFATVFFIIAYISAGTGFSLLNRLLLPENVSYYYSEEKIIPVFYMLAVPFFAYCAYRLKDQIALLFGIFFLALSAGTFSGYGHACYYLAVSRPVTQLLIGVILILTGFLHIKETEEDWKYHFGRTFQWTGLLYGFLALWIMSIWGITKPESYTYHISGMELWTANIMFLGAGIGAMAFGARREDKMFFNYGLTFLIIETYTIFFSRLWNNLGTAFGSLFLGIMFIATGYYMKRLWLKKRAQKK